MAATSKSPKRGTAKAKTQTAKAKARKARPPAPAIPLRPIEQRFTDLLQLCEPRERKFIQALLSNKSQGEAARQAGYAERSADVTGTRLLKRARVWDAYQAGLEAAGFGPQDILHDIRQLRTFDRSQIEREVKRRVTELVARPARDVLDELKKREEAVREFTSELTSADEKTLLAMGDRMLELQREQLCLVEQLALDPDAQVYFEEERIITDRVIDVDLAQKKGLSKFIKGRKPTRYGDVIELYDWTDGVEMGAKALGLFKERHELSGPNGGPITTASTANLSAEQIAEEYSRLLEEAGSG